MQRLATPLVGAIVVFTTLSTALAGGLRLPDNSPRAIGRGGAFVAKADDLTAIYFNPAKLALQRGTTLFLSASHTLLHLSFQRLGINPLNQQPFGRATPHQTFLPIPYFVLASDFGLKNWTFAIGLMAPNSVGNKSFPASGPQRYAHVASDVAMVMYTLSFAWRPLKNFSFGATLIWADLFRLRFRMIVDGNIAALNDPHYKSLEQPQFDTPIQLDAKDRINITGIIGLWYAPLRELEFGLSSFVAPINIQAKGKMKPDWPDIYKPLVNSGQLFLTDDRITVLSNFPIDIRFGTRYRHFKGDREIFDIELGFFVEFWSILKRQKVIPKGGVSALGDVSQLPPIEIAKNYKNTYSVRVGGDYHVHKYVTVRAGFLYESPGTPRETTNLDYTSFHRFGLSTGLSVHYKWFRATLGYMHIFSPPRNIAQGETRVRQTIPFTKCQPPYTDPATCPNPTTGVPPGNPVGAGNYRTGYDVLVLGFELFFDRMFTKKK
ncbi:MAG: outer membrane protein transport protein [Myxococcales bacterium]|nr:outer membrane protein transport protein [Myxococcales bacterium]